MGSQRPHSTRARKARSVPKPRRKPALKPAQQFPTSADAPAPVEECLSDAWSVLDCAVTCLDVLAENSEARPACQPADVGVLVRRAVELIRRAKESGGPGGAV